MFTRKPATEEVLRMQPRVPAAIMAREACLVPSATARRLT